MKTRDELPRLFQELYCTGIGAEIGVFRGEFSEKILEEWDGKMILVDSWKKSVPGLDMQGAYEEMLSRLGHRNVMVINLDSVEASTWVEDRSLDFVYIDADHTYESVKKDLEAWIPKVRSGGIVSGHDYFNGMYEGIDFGVKRAVDEYAKANNIEIRTTTNDPEWQGIRFLSWWFIKK